MKNEQIHEEINHSSLECTSVPEKPIRPTVDSAKLERDVALLNLLFANVDDLIDVDYDAILGRTEQPKRMEMRPKKNSYIKK